MIEGSILGVSWPLLVSVASASLLGSLHCMGMCGPLVAVYSAASSGSGSKQASPSSARDHRVLAHVAYHGGRGLTYSLAGVLAGAGGSLVDFAGEAAGLARIAAWTSSLLLILWGVGVLAPGLPIHSPFTRFFGRRLVQLGKKPPVVRASLLGALTPLLPCGWFYAFVLVAAGTGAAASGGLVMLVFWAGTVPGLLGMGAVVSRLSARLRARLPLVTGAALIVIGALGIVSRMSHPLDLRAGRPALRPDGSPPAESDKPSCH